MESLRQRDFRELNEFLRGSYESESREAFSAHALRALGRLVPADAVTFNVIHARRGVLKIDREPAHVGPDRNVVLTRYASQHPMIEHYKRTGDGQAYRVSDFMTQRQFHRLALYQEYYGVSRVEFQMTVGLTTPVSFIVGFGFNRSHPDFSERERLLVNVLRPHLIQAHHNAHVMERLHARLAVLGRALESADLGLILLTADGRVEFTTLRARRWVEEYFGWPGRRGDRLPDDLGRWVHQATKDFAQSFQVPKPRRPLVVAHADRQLEISLVSNGGLPTLVLDERGDEPDMADLVSLGLSRRETEVLLWVARGKTDAETSTILGISPRTVGKHLEHVFQKLGVETRTAAAVLALETARGARMSLIGSPSHRRPAPPLREPQSSAR